MTVAGFVILRFPFTCCITLSFSFCFVLMNVKTSLEAIIFEPHEDRNDLYSFIHVLYNTTELHVSRSVF